MLLPTDLERIILRYAAIYYPFYHMRKLTQHTCNMHHISMRELHRQFGPYAWSPTYCNVLNWSWINPGREKKRRLLGYSAVTHMTPRRKEMIETFRRELGYVAIYPGDLQYPTSRVRFDPQFHTNDRYFR